MNNATLSRRDRIRRIAAVVSLIVALALLSVGCQTDPTGGFGDEVFPGETADRSVNQFTRVQAASGARQDATLRAAHFDGNQLNSLGREKLDLMLEDDDQVQPMIVWIDADESVATSRGESVADYLAKAGLEASQFEFKTGENPENYSPVAPNLANLPKTDTGSAGSTPAEQPSSNFGPEDGTSLLE